MSTYQVSAATVLAAVMLAPVMLLADAFVITRTLSFGMQGDDVRALQTMLARDPSVYPEALVTGYFGSLTRRAVQRFQCAQNIVCSGDEASTGYGQVGPRTREALQRVFGSVAAVTTPTPRPAQNAAPNAEIHQCASPPLEPTIACSGHWNKIHDTYQCHVGWTCVSAIATSTTATNAAPKVPVNRPPFISAIAGPTKLKPGESGTWTVVASDPEYEAIEYSIIWGDEGGVISQLLDLARLGIYTFSRQTTYTHTYQASGAYTIVIFAKDTEGNDTKATLSVMVKPPAPALTQWVAPAPTGNIDGTTLTLQQMVDNTANRGALPYCFGILEQVRRDGEEPFVKLWVQQATSAGLISSVEAENIIRAEIAKCKQNPLYEDPATGLHR